jgi:hypothetical protein
MRVDHYGRNQDEYRSRILSVHVRSRLHNNCSVRQYSIVVKSLNNEI